MDTVDIEGIINVAIEENTFELSVSKMGIREIPPQIGQLIRINTLHMSNNLITVIPAEIAKLKKLEELDASFNKISTIPKEVFSLKKMKRLYFRNNLIKEIPNEIKELKMLEELDLRENPLSIPSEILERITEPNIILDYYFTYLKGERRPLNEVKVLLVGQGSVGKTSLVKQLTSHTFNLLENKTAGISIQPWKIKIENEVIALNLWDFGGQEIMHATHQFFLTKRSLYLIVLDTRLSAEENRLEYWLKITQSFSEDSPIIVIGNKIDQHPLDINRREIMNKYPNIKAVVETSCSNGLGIDNLQETINSVISKIPYIHDELPITWFSIKEKLSNMKEDYIPYEKYVIMCEEERITDGGSQRVLIRFLHDLGVVLNFQDDPRLGDTNILNPTWVTNGVYQIINSNTLFQAKGVLEYKQLEEILDPIRYPQHHHFFIIEMMKKFELCFEFDDQTQKFLIPDLLPKDTPYIGIWDKPLSFIYRYNVLPSNVISRFIVRMHPYIHENTVWRSGVLLTFGKISPNIALVTADFEDRCITVLIKGPVSTRRDAMAIIRGQLDSIHHTIPGLVVSQKVPIPEHPEAEPIDFEFLLQLERDGRGIVPIMLNNSIVNIEVWSLLNGLDSPTARQARSKDGNRENAETSKKKTSDLFNMSILVVPKGRFAKFLFMILIYFEYALGQFVFDIIASGKKVSNMSKLIAGYSVIIVLVLFLRGVISSDVLRSMWHLISTVINPAK